VSESCKTTPYETSRHRLLHLRVLHPCTAVWWMWAARSPSRCLFVWASGRDHPHWGDGRSLSPVQLFSANPEYHNLCINHYTSDDTGTMRQQSVWVQLGWQLAGRCDNRSAASTLDHSGYMYHGPTEGYGSVRRCREAVPREDDLYAL